MLHQGRAGVRHAGHLYSSLFRWAAHPVQTVEGEARHLREVEREGYAGVTPFIAILGVFLFLVPVFLFMLGVAFLAIVIHG
jgi:VIT1/CCC1 family predicted Fe2+/Mn2+ transporter